MCASEAEKGLLKVSHTTYDGLPYTKLRLTWNKALSSSYMT